MAGFSVEPLGLIAGGGIFPLLVARGARAAGRPVVCVAFRGAADESLRTECDHFRFVSVTRIGSWIRALRSAGCQQAIMVGNIAKSKMYDPWRYLRYIPDLRTLRLYLKRVRRDKRPYSVLSAVADDLASAGINLIDSTQYCQDHLATTGVMTRRQPTAAQQADMRFGWEIAQAVSRMDIGQCIAVLNRDVLAVEALEGTSAMIERAGRLCRGGGWTLVKVSNTRGDMRLDVPSIGVETIELLRAARAGCVALEPGKTIILEKPKVLDLADKYGIAVVGWSGS